VVEPNAALHGKGAIIPLRLGRLKVSEQELERFVQENQGRDLDNLGRRYK
jgi:hypothetical protein